MKRRKRRQELPAPAATQRDVERDVLADEKTARKTAAEGPARESRGEPLERRSRRDMERLLGVDLGEVRVHRDTVAAESAEALGAAAYTHGRDLYFRRDRYAPESPAGRELLAHELAHVVQTGGRSRPGSSHVEQPGSGLEQEARRAAAEVRAGRQPEIRLRAPAAAILRQEEEETAAPKMSVHSRQITPAHGRGTIAAGPFLIAFRYEIAEGGEGALVLDIPEGVEASFAPLGEGDVTVADPGGTGARRVRISVGAEAEGVPKVRARFSQESTTYVVIFQLPVPG